MVLLLCHGTLCGRLRIMEFGSVAAIAGAVISLVFSLLAFKVSLKNSRDTRAYKDPVFVMECVPMVLDRNASHTEQQDQVTFKLINKGDAFATDVQASAEFDPFGLQVHKMDWPFVERSGGHVLWTTQVGVTPASAGILSQVDMTSGANMCVINFRSQAGHECTQRIPLPNVFSFVTFKEEQIF